MPAIPRTREAAVRILYTGSPREDGPIAGRLSPIEDMSEPTTEADEELVDAFFSLGLSAEEMRALAASAAFLAGGRRF